VTELSAAPRQTTRGRSCITSGAASAQGRSPFPLGVSEAATLSPQTSEFTPERFGVQVTDQKYAEHELTVRN
jgi:hypothetical protein